MSAESASRLGAAIPDGAAPGDGVIDVISCSRLGRTANPPTRSFTDWLRPRRRRLDTVSGA